MRYVLCWVAFAVALAHAADLHSGTVVKGKLLIRQGQPPAIETPDHQTLQLDGDDTTRKVLSDPRLNGFEAQARGHFTSPGHFLIDGSYNHPLLVKKDGKLKLITYWCDVCSIRSYTPGPCVCCQRETALDLRDPDQQ